MSGYCLECGNDLCICSELEEEAKKQPDVVFICQRKEIEKLQEENKILREVLEFYADPEKWIFRREDTWSKVDPKWHGDGELIKKYKHPKTDWIGSVEVGGKRAREALAKVKE